MNRIIFSILIMGLIGCQMALANPLPPYEFVYIKAFPPEIGLSLYDTTDLSGVTIITTTGIAIVDSGVIGEGDRWDPFILDSSNTSGFVLNPEADSIHINLPWLETAAWGRYGRASTPIKGHWLIQKFYGPDPPYGMTIPILSFDFANPYQGFADVIINEVNAHGDWAPGCNFVELYNKATRDIDIGGWMIVCDTIYSIPRDAIIHGHGYYVINENSFPAVFDMDINADNIFLITADSEIVDQVGWSSDHSADISFMRMPDGNADEFPYKQGYWGYNDESSITFEDGFPSRGAFNRYNSPGLKIIGIHADTVNGRANFYWTNPIWLTTFSQAILRRSTAGYPSTPYDGDIVYEGSGQEFIGDTLTPGIRYYYTIYARTGCGDYSEPDSESQVSVLFPNVGVSNDLIPEKAGLLECYPNPFNASTLIRYRLTESGQTRLAIYNLGGQKVAILHDGNREAGEHSVIWDGGGFSSGIYFAKLESGAFQSGIKLALLK